MYDLHCHSTASDGTLSPTDVVLRAAEKGVTTLALTDHDCVSGLNEAHLAASQRGITLIPGIELSTTWKNQCIHVVGLGIDPLNPELRQGIKHLADIRANRAREIGRRLAKLGFPEVYDVAMASAGQSMITRVHFARALVRQGHTVDEKAAFERFLVRGKLAFVSTEWAALGDAIGWIRAAGGLAVIAHPLRYKLTATKMRELLAAFRSAGGAGIEVVTGNSTPDEVRHSTELAAQNDLLASVGSDFHSPEQHWVELGRLQALPEKLTPVWRHWQ